MSNIPDSHERAKDIFMRAVEQESTELRNRVVDEACAGNPELRQEVDDLIGSFKDAGSFLEHKPGAALDLTTDSGSPRSSGLEATMATASLAKPGTILAGKYKLLEVIGEGGMGSIWVAQQSKPIKRKVAI
jgi:serine/threonine-protein kinase